MGKKKQEDAPAPAAAPAPAPEEEKEVADAECDDEEPPTVDGEEEEAPPTHDPFTVKVLSMVATQQSLNGLRHNDHLRYRQYCARRLRRLHNVLRYKNGRGRFKHNPFPEHFTDQRFLEIPLVHAERAWSYGVQLKADNAAASSVNPRLRHHSIQRFAKAAKWARFLESVCKNHGDQRTQLEAEAYCAFLEGTYLVQKEEWSEALNKLMLCKRTAEQLAIASGPSDAPHFKAKVQELAPMIRECKYNLGQGYEEDDDKETGKKTTGKKTSKGLSEISYRGNGLVIPSDKIKGALEKCLSLAKQVKADEKQDSSTVIERYGEVSAEFGDVLKEIHTDMIAAGAEGQTTEWSMLEAFARELSITLNVERNTVLLSNHLSKLDDLEDIGSSETRRVWRPEEGMRFCDLLKEDINNLRELPETSDAISSALNAMVTVVLNCRAFFLALCHTSLGKSLESAALMDMLHARVEDVDLGKALMEPLGRLHPLFDRVQQGMPSRVGQWRCRGLARLCMGATKTGKAADAVAPQPAQASLEDIAGLEAFPPRFRDIPCKPLLFDLAFPCIMPPDLEELLPKKPAQGEQKSLLGKMAGGIGSRIGGLWGRK